MKKQESEQGFTLMEMLVVLLIIGIILAIAIPNLKAAGDKAQKRADEANRKLISQQAENYYLEHGVYPASVDQLVKEKYLQSAPVCPGGKGKYIIHPNPNLPPEKRVTCEKE